MGERALDAIAGIVFVIIILGLEYLHVDIGLAKPFFWVFAILFHAHVFGKHIAPNRSWGITFIFGLLLLVAAQSVIQTIWFYAGGALGHLSDAWSLAIAIAISHITGLKTEHSVTFQSTPSATTPIKWTPQTKIMAGILLAAALGGAVFVVYGAYLGQTMDSIRTPWPLLPHGTLIAIALLWMCAALSAIFIGSGAFTAVHSFLAMGSTLSIAPLIYKIGYGFDGFLHQAGEQIILKTGFLNPKPYYYVGQYVFTTWLARMAELPLDSIDRWLVPVVAAFALPASVLISLNEDDWKGGAALGLALFPLGMFVATTPQGLATILGISAVILGMGARKQNIQFGASLWLGLWSMTIHPLAGIPLLILTTALYIMGDREGWIKHIAWPMAVISGLAIPFVFYLASRFTGTISIDWNLNQILNLDIWINELSRLAPWLGNKFVLWPAWSSLVNLSLPAIGLVASIFSFILLKKNDRLATLVLLISSLSLFAGSILLRNAGDFTFLIQYERGDYADRLWQIAIYVILLAGLPAIGLLIKRVRAQVPVFSAVVIILLGTVGAANAYNALPRHDAVQASRGWSTGKADLQAVRWIDQYAKGQAYTVLANQSVSAAAVKEFGFKRYNNDVFFYPIPTGGPLYEVYLKVTYEDQSLDTIKDAGQLGGTDLVFVVINDYWWKAPELNESLSEIADHEWSIENDKVKIYVFNLP